MRIAIQTLGTRGDVQPYIALAKRLSARGHDVQISAPAQFESFVTEHEIPSSVYLGNFSRCWKRQKRRPLSRADRL